MSRLHTFLTYKDYDEFSRAAHCSKNNQVALGLHEMWVDAYCRNWSKGHSSMYCADCILDSNHAFKAEALLTEKGT